MLVLVLALLSVVVGSKSRIGTSVTILIDLWGGRERWGRWGQWEIERFFRAGKGREEEGGEGEGEEGGGEEEEEEEEEDEGKREK